MASPVNVRRGLLVVAYDEYLETNRCLQLDQVIAPRLFSLPIFIPAFCRNRELVGNRFQLRREGRMVNAQDDSGEAQIAELHCEPQTVCGPAPLIDDGKVGLAERVMPDQLIVCVWQTQADSPAPRWIGSNGGALVLLSQTRAYEKPQSRSHVDTGNQGLRILVNDF
jgi:hypothetical protein